ncbi:hypothetical protein CBF34_02395 [Vagococcus penaei]|uniref:Uncharacterized protein n=1 Tax=Vagococcus penaei TaxID=633807 RepID=A0A1Q2D833_9ENTE|nr:YutD family protein [Vagococcus penaei]AQP54471.1 hypothetical protein BW732_09700 [Vagococcus penaei]RSU06390.1 hypothetical protein CBF34_02395 [Vagococcus penaei]
MNDKKNSDKELEKDAIIEELTASEQKRQALLASFSPDSFSLGKGTYRLVYDYREGFDYEKLLDRYQEILEKYDYIVGDWGYDQLRLKGFFKDDFKNAAIDAKISHLSDYLYEYCNFGCAYFVIEQIGEFQRKGRDTSSTHNQKKNKKNPRAPKNSKDVKRKDNFKRRDRQDVKHTAEKKQAPTKKNSQQPNNKKRTFKMRQKERD